VEQGRQQLAARQVAGAPEDHEVERPPGDRLAQGAPGTSKQYRYDADIGRPLDEGRRNHLSYIEKLLRQIPIAPLV
jgi:hypothetical protein